MFLKRLTLTVFASALVAMLGCEQKDAGGGFRGADIKDPGVHVKPSDKKGPPNFVGAMRLQPRYDKATGELLVMVSVRPGYHAYAPGSSIGVPISMNLKDTGGWKVDGDVVLPKGKEKTLGTLGTDFVLEGEIPIKAKVKDGSGDISGRVKVQICTTNACDRPKEHGFTVPTT